MKTTNDRPADGKTPATTQGSPLGGRPATPLLDRVTLPADLRNFSVEQLEQLAAELRAETIDAVSTTGGHLRRWAWWS